MNRILSATTGFRSLFSSPKKKSATDQKVEFTFADCKNKAIETLKEKASSLLSSIGSIYRIESNLNLDSKELIDEGLQGECATRVLIKLQALLSDYSKEHNSEKLKTIMKVLEETATYSALFSALQDASTEGKNITGAYRSLCESIADNIKQMKPSSNPKVFAGGWSASHFSGHMVLFEFKCVEVNNEKRIEFSIINRGLGLEHHGKVKDNRINNFVVTDIEPKDITPQFIEQLFKGRTVDEGKAENTLWKRIGRGLGLVKGPCQKGISKIYNLANKHLIENHSGKLKTEGVPQHRVQRQGSCAARGLTAWIHEQLGEEAPNFKLYMAQRSRSLLSKVYYKFKPGATYTDYEKDVAKHRKPSIWTRVKLWWSGRATTPYMIAMMEKVEKRRREKIPQEIIQGPKIASRQQVELSQQCG